jgi:glutamine phosphoribosylpyrophosphate amidotransferase
MCAIIGTIIDHPTTDDLESIQRVFLESRIRGMHATGISYTQDGVVKTIKEAIPAHEFVDRHMQDMTSFIDTNGRLALIGHCRYSTSDLEFNQPIANSEVSIVHNGVITQELPENWKGLYGYDCETRNDTELLLHTIKDDKSPLEVWSNSSLAVIELYSNQTMRFYRNGKRPMYLTNSIITSTKDVINRAGIKEDSILLPMNQYNKFDMNMNIVIEKVDIDGAIDYQQ